MRELTRTIKAEAFRLGFSKVGIARAEELTDEGQRLQEWLHHGYQATMHWLERDVAKRIDPRRVFPGAKSVVCVALNYYTPARHSDDSSVGKISRYAWGDDYHDVLTERLEQLASFIKQQIPVAKTKIYVDTGPVMDKAWAVRAGVGWLGKHTNVITKEFGSWVFLGEILLDCELAYDEPIADFCGTCTACIEACPTDAIVEPYVLDSNKCISYLTIEHRGDLPPDAASTFENWIYGCDICQDVCPWNKSQQPTKEAAFEPREVNLAPKLSELVLMTQAEFSHRFKKSPIKRTKHAGLVRNASAVVAAKTSETI